VTDDSKEFAFSSVIRWLKEANFVIKEEKSTIVTSDFYAKMLSPVYPLHPIELKSNPSLGNGILIQVNLTLTPKQIMCFTNLDGKLKLDIEKKISSPLNSSNLILTDSGDILILERMITFGSQLLQSKHELIDLISGMLETINNLQKIEQ
jgi:hypothetical protein